MFPSNLIEMKSFIKLSKLRNIFERNICCVHESVSHKGKLNKMKLNDNS